MVEITNLPNGIRVITDKMADVETVSLGIWVGVGSRYEEKQINGISHFMEHMAFKGTNKRTALQIAEEIENVGGDINAYTADDKTAFHAKVLKEDVPMAISVLSDIFQHSILPPEELERERGVVIQEIGRCNDSPDRLIFDLAGQTAYPDQPFGRPTLGTIDIIQSMSRETLLSYYHDEYITPRIVFSAAGNLNHQQIVDCVMSSLTDLKQSGGRSMEKAEYKGGDLRKSKDRDQVNLILSLHGLEYSHPLRYAQSVLAAILGGGMSSRLFQEVREKRGLVYSIFAHSSSDVDTGDFVIYAGTGEKQVAELLPVVCDELLKVESTLTEQEIRRAKTQIKAALLMQREDTSARCDSNACCLLNHNRYIDKDEIVQKIEQVDKEALVKTMNLLLSSRPTLATLGPIKHVMDYDELCCRLKQPKVLKHQNRAVDRDELCHRSKV